MFAKTLKWTGLALGLGVGLAGCLFAAGYTFTDLPLGIATGVTALWVLPMVVLSIYALRHPEPAARVLLLTAVGITVFAFVDAFSDLVPSDEWGPVATVMDMALVVTVSFFAVRRPGRAGKLLIPVALVQFVALVVNVVMHETGALPPGPGFANPAVVLWMLLVGALFLMAAKSDQTPRVDGHADDGAGLTSNDPSGSTTMRRVPFIVGLTGSAILLLGGCGGDGSEPSPSPSPASATLSSSQAAVPTAEQLAALLVTAETYDGTWSVNVPPDAQSAIDGVVPESQQEMLPSIQLCAKASEKSRAAADALQWQAFRQLDQSEENPIDMAKGDRVGHMVFVQEFLLAGDPTGVETTFNALRDGVRACEGEIPAGEEGPGKAEPMTIPDVGEDRFGELTTMEEAGGGAYWLLHTSWVRQGPVLMNLQVVDIVMGDGVQPAFTTEDLDTFLTSAVDNLP